jgi:acyl-CoA thioester hydrolase
LGGKENTLSATNRSPIARDDFHYVLPIDVQWADMDTLGHVNNARYFTYCESARMHYFHEVGMEAYQKGDGQEGHGPALVTATCNFLRQVHWPAALEVGARVDEIRRSSFRMDYGIFHRDTGELVADGTSVVVWVNYAAGKSVPLPEGLKRAIQSLEGDG